MALLLCRVSRLSLVMVEAMSGVRDVAHHSASLSRQYVSVKPVCPAIVVVYTGVVPRLWTETIEAHRHAVHEALLDTTAALVAQHGLHAVTMSQIADAAGIGRATLYKY